MQVDYVQHWGDDLITANAARVSFDKHSNYIGAADAVLAGMHIEAKENKNEVDEKYLAYVDQIPNELLDPNQGSYLDRRDFGLIFHLAKEGHTSCFEHMGATLKLKVPIVIARHIHRHRTFSYNEISRRYVDTTPEFFYPEVMRARAKNVKQGSGTEAADTTVDLSWYVGVAVGAYEKMLEDGVAPEIARMILPQNMYTEFYMTGNLRAWEHFLKLRLDGDAQYEVQEVARMVEKILQPLFPVSMKALMEN